MKVYGVLLATMMDKQHQHVGPVVVVLVHEKAKVSMQLMTVICISY